MISAVVLLAAALAVFAGQGVLHQSTSAVSTSVPMARADDIVGGGPV